MRAQPKSFPSAPPGDTGPSTDVSSASGSQFGRAGDPVQTTANHIRRHGRPRSHTPAVQRIDTEHLDRVLKGMDQ